MGGKTTATSGRRAASRGGSMDLRALRQFTSLAPSGWCARSRRTACWTVGGGSRAARPAAGGLRWAPGKYGCPLKMGANIVQSRRERNSLAPGVHVEVRIDSWCVDRSDQESNGWITSLTPSGSPSRTATKKDLPDNGQIKQLRFSEYVNPLRIILEVQLANENQSYTYIVRLRF